MPPFAHSANTSGSKHQLHDHLRDVARLAGDLAGMTQTTHLSLVEMARWAGWLHDLGKYRVEFQEYLDHHRSKSVATRHSVYGAAAALIHSPPLPAALAFVINGHHAGLDDAADLKTAILDREVAARHHAKTLWDQLRTDAASELPPPLTEFLLKDPGRSGDTCHDLLIRMLFSCLVDADYLDTERHFRGQIRQPTPLDPGALLNRVRDYVRQLGLTSQGDSKLRDLREQIFTAGLEAARSPTGLFSLTTPTGGGKTLASLAFALQHAEVNNLRRVVVVIPFLSIIEQTARIYREVLGDGNLVEHHSAVVPDKAKSGGEERERSASELATENWDAPVVVTTAVQFLESLFARSPARCRKLHNLARSVVVFDEVQTWPHRLLDPTLDVIRELSRSYGASFLFCSATQPGFRRHGQGLPSGFQPDEVVEIAPDPAAAFSTLNRVRFDIAALAGNPWTWSELVDRIKIHQRVLTIVNTRRHAVEVYRAIRDSVPPDEQASVWHLSNAMCPDHRLQVLRAVRQALKEGKPCRLVATQLIEAGVDVDFPVVFRTLAPLDALIQSAGRCNREGKLVAADGGPGGQFIVFQPVEAVGSRPYSDLAISLTKNTLCRIQADPARLGTDPTLFADYFNLLVASVGKETGSCDIQDERRKLNFKTVAELARVIEDSGTAVVVPYGSGQAQIDKFKQLARPTRDDFRSLKPYLVNLRDTDIAALGDWVRPIHPNLEGSPLWLQSSGYHDHEGVLVQGLPPDDFVCD